MEGFPETIRNDEVFTVDGNITVESTGNLTMDTSNITIDDFLYVEGSGDKVFINGNIMVGGNN